MHLLAPKKKDDEEKIGWFEQQVLGSLEDKIIPYVLKYASKMADAMNERGINMLFSTLKIKDKDCPVLVLLDAEKMRMLPKEAGKLVNKDAVIEVVNIADKASFQDFIKRIKNDGINFPKKDNNTGGETDSLLTK